MEHNQGLINFDSQQITESEREYASNSYLMNLFALMAGLPLPLINLIASFVFFVAHRNSPLFVRWHCTQALLSQIFVFFFNTAGFCWTVYIIFRINELNNYYIAYISLVILINIVEVISTIYTMIKVRNGEHVRWFLFGDMTDKFVSD